MMRRPTASADAERLRTIAAEGRVTHAGWKSGYGQAIDIAHGNGILTRYAHLSRIGVKVGQQIDAGATIGGLAVSFVVAFAGFVLVLVMAVMLESELRLVGREDEDS